MSLKKQTILSIPGSKSIALRALIIATFAETPLSLKNLPGCNDVLTLLEALRILGFTAKESKEETVIIPANLSQPREVSIYIRDSAAALRFLAVRLAVLSGVKAKLELSPQLRSRPVTPLPKLINVMGGYSEYDGQYLTIKGTKSLAFNRKAEHFLSTGQTSQLASAILLSLPSIDIDLQGLKFLLQERFSKVSHKYTELTAGIMRDFGFSEKIISASNNGCNIRFQYTNPGVYTIEPDISSACYFWALACLKHKQIAVRTGKTDSLQPDYRFLDVLSNMGAKVRYNDDWVSVEAESLQSVRVSMKDMPDQAPTLAVLALTGQGKVIITGIRHLRYKESDRLEGLLTELKKTGADIIYKEGTLIIRPLTAEPPAVTLDCRGDHRLVMAFSLLRELYPQLNITDSEAVAKSFPGFFKSLEQCRE